MKDTAMKINLLNRKKSSEPNLHDFVFQPLIFQGNRTAPKTNMTMENGSWMKMYVLLNMQEILASGSGMHHHSHCTLADTSLGCQKDPIVKGILATPPKLPHPRKKGLIRLTPY